MTEWSSIPVTPRPPFVPAVTPEERKARWDAAVELVKGERARRQRRAREAKFNRFIDWLVAHR